MNTEPLRSLYTPFPLGFRQWCIQMRIRHKGHKVLEFNLGLRVFYVRIFTKIRSNRQASPTLKKSQLGNRKGVHLV